MAIRVHFPADVNPDPDAKYHRSMAEAFPCAAQLDITVRRFSAPSRLSVWLAAALMLLICLATSGCGSAEAQAHHDSTDLQHEPDAARACPDMTPVWIDTSTVECFKEKL